MSAPHPDDVDVIDHDIRRMSRRLPDLYRWLHSAGFVPRSGGHPGSGSDESMVNDVARLLGVTGTARAKLATAGRKYAQALQCLQGAEAALHELGELIDAGADRTLDDETDRIRRRPEEWPAIKAALEAKLRRITAGEPGPEGGIIRSLAPRYDAVKRKWEFDQQRRDRRAAS